MTYDIWSLIINCLLPPPQNRDRKIYVVVVVVCNLRTLKLPFPPQNVRIEISFKEEVFLFDLTDIVYNHWNYRIWCGCSHENGFAKQAQLRSRALFQSLFPNDKKTTEARKINPKCFISVVPKSNRINFTQKISRKLPSPPEIDVTGLQSPKIIYFFYVVRFGAR